MSSMSMLWKRRWALVAGASCLVVAVLALYLSPYLTLQRMQAAAAAHEGERLAEWIDFPALRANLKSGVHQRLALARQNAQGQPTPASLMGAAVAGALLGPMVDALITPDSLARLLRGQKPAQALLKPQGADKSDAEPSKRLETQMRYEGLNRFVFSVRQAGEDEDPIDLVLSRQGLFSWRLTELRLP
ncbi:DUF2939 domain-containing protein [Roseateles sp.]|uniref:DUF2939 domain-containing protein n=1 Tax=Roseateles sp. TaxID=1971397 RepID=UPI003BA7C591